MVTKSNRHKMVEVECLNCSTPFMARKQRVDQGFGKFCSAKCYGEWQKENKPSQRIGYENASVHFDKSQKRYFVQWVDEETGKKKTTTWSKWAWETTYGEIPEGHVVRFKDGDSTNIDVKNLYLAEAGEWAIPPEMTEEMKHKLSVIHTGKVLSEEHKRDISSTMMKHWENGRFDKVHKGKYNHYYKDGKSKPYPVEFYEISPFIRSRDNHVCQICGKNVYRSRHGHVHHIDGDKTYNEPDNLILLCSSCHSKVHHPNGAAPATIMAFYNMLKY